MSSAAYCGPSRVSVVEACHCTVRVLLVASLVVTKLQQTRRPLHTLLVKLLLLVRETMGHMLLPLDRGRVNMSKLKESVETCVGGVDTEAPGWEC